VCVMSCFVVLLFCFLVVGVGWGGGGGGGGGTNLPPTIQTSVNFHNLAELLYYI